MSRVDQILAILGGIAAIMTVLTSLAVAITKRLGKLIRQNDEFREDWYGTPARPGRPPQPGVMERLAALEQGLIEVSNQVRGTA